MHLIVLSICNCMKREIKFTLHWLQYSTGPNVLTLHSKKNHKQLKVKLNPLFLQRWMDVLGFYVPSTVFQSFRDDGRVNMKSSVQ